MKRKIAVFSIFILSILSLMFFQNCNKVQMQDVSSTAEKASGEGGAVDQQGGGAGGSGGGGSGSEEADDNEEKELLTACNNFLKNSKQAITIADGNNLTNLRGNLFIKADHLAVVSGIYGNFHALGLSATSSIDVLDASYGNMIICGMDVKTIRNYTSGNLYIVQGDVGNINGFHGNLRLVGGKITGTIENVSGNLKQ